MAFCLLIGPTTVTDKRPPLSRQGSRLAILVYQGSDPTQPYPTLVIRQSATLSVRLFALDIDDVVRPLGRDRCYVGSASPDSVDLTRFTPSLAKTAGRISPRALGPDPRLFWSRASSSANEAASSRWSEGGSWTDRGVEVSQELIRSDRMIKRKSDQLFKNVIPLLSARVPKGHPAGHHLVGDPAEPAGDPDADVAGVHLLEPPSRGQDPEVLVAS